MYLSSIPVETGSDPTRPRPGRMWVSNPYRVHQRLCMAFDCHPRNAPLHKPGERRTCTPSRGNGESVLFRIEGPIPTSRGMRPRVLAQSSQEPDWDAAFGNAPFLVVAPDIQVQRDEREFRTGDRCRFLLRANPTVKRNGKRLGIIEPEGQVSWLQRKADGAGFALLGDVELRDRGLRHARRSKMLDPNPHTHLAVTYAGILEVRDPDSFHAVLRNGIGPAKGYGFGLLSVARLRE